MRNHRLTVLLITVATLAGGHPADVSQASPTAEAGESPTVAEIASGYQEYRKMTSDGHLVNPEFLLDCAGTVSEEEQFEIYGPHSGTSIRIFMNEAAVKTFRGRRTAAESYPVGAVIVKEKIIHQPPKEGFGKGVERGTMGVGGMVKRASGYDPSGGDWEYFYFSDPEDIEAGVIRSCATCHQGARSRDFVFGTWASPSLTPDML